MYFYIHIYHEAAKLAKQQQSRNAPAAGERKSSENIFIDATYYIWLNC